MNLETGIKRRHSCPLDLAPGKGGHRDLDLYSVEPVGESELSHSLQFSFLLFLQDIMGNFLRKYFRPVMSILVLRGQYTVRAVQLFLLVGYHSPHT